MKQRAGTLGGHKPLTNSQREGIEDRLECGLVLCRKATWERLLAHSHGDRKARVLLKITFILQVIFLMGDLALYPSDLWPLAQQ